MSAKAVDKIYLVIVSRRFAQILQIHFCNVITFGEAIFSIKIFRYFYIFVYSRTKQKHFWGNMFLPKSYRQLPNSRS